MDAGAARYGQFHCITIAKDGLVLVGDRSHNRMQMFRRGGTFVREISVLKDSAPGTVENGLNIYTLPPRGHCL
jgi:hypothetical protein